MKKKDLLWCLWVFIFLIFNLSIYLFTNFYLPIENIFYDLRFKIRGPVQPQDKVVIVKIDQQSLESLGRWPWDRKILAKAIENLFKAGVKIVGLDIIFPEESNKVSDKVLSKVLKQGNSVVASHFEKVYENILVGNVIKKTLTEEYIPPIKEIYDSSKVGFANIEPDSDGIVRKIDLVKLHNDKNYYSFDYVIVNNYLNAENQKIPDMIYINFYGPSEFADIKNKKIFSTFKKYSFVSVYEDIIPHSWLKDKIVLIGSTATGVYDHYPIPFVESYPGVEIHATVIENLLSNTYLKKGVKITTRVILIFILNLLLGYIFYKTHPILTTFSIVILNFGYFFISYLFFLKNIILETVPYFVSIFLVGFGSILYKLLFEQQEKKLIKKTFSKYINPYIMEELLNNPKSSLSSLGGEKRVITVVFTDIRQFTTISEKLSPENVVEFLNQYFEVMNNIIFKYNGTVDKYIGDSIMFFWNAPLEQLDHEFLAVSCVLEMFSKIEELNNCLGKNFRLQIGAGINTGEAIVGNIGSPKLMEYTAVGDTVNIASRLQDLTKEYNSPIIISEFVYQKIKDRIPTCPLGKIKLRGKEKEIEIFKVGNFCYQ